MHLLLQKIFDQLEDQRKNLLAEVGGLTAEKLNGHPPGKWSINQILAHLISAERLSHQYLRKKILAVNDVADSGIWEESKMLFLKISQRVPGLKFKAPKVVIEHTSSYESFIQLQEDWNKIRYDLKAFLEIVKPEHIKRKIYKHAWAGRMNVIQGLLFFREHIIHHMPQIRKLAKRK